LRRARFVAGLALLIVAVALVLYLELPLRAGLLRAPLVYGQPQTVGGFLYVVLAQQFIGSLSSPFGDFLDKLGALIQLGYEQFGVLVMLIPAGFLVTALRRPRY